MKLNEERNHRIDDLKEKFIRGECLNIKDICILYRVSEQTARGYITQAKHLAELKRLEKEKIEKIKTSRRIRSFRTPSEHIKVSNRFSQTIKNAEKEYKKIGLKLFESDYPNDEGFTRQWGSQSQVKRWTKEARENKN